MGTLEGKVALVTGARRRTVKIRGMLESRISRRVFLAGSLAATALGVAPQALSQRIGRNPTPFRIATPQAKLDEIRRQVTLARVAAPMPDPDPGSHGMTSRWLEDLRQHWITAYDWRAAEAELNRFPQYVVEIEGQPIHFFHVPGTGPDPKPILLLHGWPYSNATFVPFVTRLTDPAKFGGSSAQALTAVIPAIPGTGFGGRPSRIWTPKELAELFHRLMTDILGYARFGLQGGDQGCVIAPALAVAHPKSVIGLHLNLVPTLPLPQAQQTTDERAWNDAGARFMAAEMDYFRAHVNKPLMVAAALAASPFSTAAWISEKYWSWTDHGGDLDRVIAKDRLLTEIMVFATTDTIESSIWQYRPFRTEPFYPDRAVDAPTALYVPRKEFVIGNPPRPAVERTYRLVRDVRPERGMHFPMLEQPDSFAADIRDFFASI